MEEARAMGREEGVSELEVTWNGGWGSGGVGWGGDQKLTAWLSSTMEKTGGND